MTRRSTSSTVVEAGQVRHLLEAGGMSWPAVVNDGRPAGSAAALPKYSPLSDPIGAERLGATLAERVRAREPNVVVVWEDSEDAILAYIVARELGVRAVRTWNADGLVAHAGSLPPDAQALILADAFRDATPLLAMKAFIEQQGGLVTAAAVLVKTAGVTAAGVDVIGLATLPGEGSAG